METDKGDLIMKRKLDFVIYEDDNKRLLFRFYPKTSHVHGFSDECPTAWEEVYKVYYAWAIIRQYKWSENDNWESEKLFELDDECSEFVNLDDIIQYVIDNKEKYTRVISIGQPASEWEIFFDKDYKNKEYIKIQVWDTWSDKGFKFSLYLDKAKEFIEYIKNTNEYMLNHSEPI